MLKIQLRDATLLYVSYAYEQAVSCLLWAQSLTEDTQNVRYVMKKDHWFLGYVRPYLEVGDRGE
jgi:hypothetical protein